MGIFSGFKLSASVAGSNVLPFPKRSSIGIVSPYSDSSNALEQLVASDILGVEIPLVTRAQAMMIPSVVKARALLHAVIASHPLRAYRDGQPLTDQPTWLYRSDTGVAARMRTKLILDDLIFNEASLLRVERGSENQITDAWHVAYNRWEVSERGEILIDREPVPFDSVVWIPGPGPGLLVQARELIPAAVSTERAWASRVRNPFPAMVIEHTTDDQLDPEEAKEFVRTVAEARRNPDNAVMYVQNGLTIKAHQADSTDLFESGRNALRLDFANMLNMPAAVLDGSVSEASLTYSTQEGRRNDFLDLTIPYWAGPIEDALSLDNVVPRGQYVRFDFTDLTAPANSGTGPTVED